MENIFSNIVFIQANPLSYFEQQLLAYHQMSCFFLHLISYIYKKITVSFHNGNVFLDNKKQPPSTTCNIQIFALKKPSLDRKYSKSQKRFSVGVNPCLCNSSAQ